MCNTTIAMALITEGMCFVCVATLMLTTNAMLFSHVMLAQLFCCIQRPPAGGDGVSFCSGQQQSIADSAWC
jgi:hypothetical protein